VGIAQIIEEKPSSSTSQRTGGPRPSGYGQGSRPAFDHFSFTQFQAFRNCPLQYKFAHIIKIPTEPKASLSFGKIMHETLEQFMRESAEGGASAQQALLGGPVEQKQPLTLDRLLSIFKSQWKDEASRAPKKKKKRN